MEKKDKFLLLFLLLLIPAVISAQVTITPPTVNVTNPLLALIAADLEDAINSQLESAADEMEIQLNTEIEPFLNQEDLVLGFSNAGASAAHSGTQRAYNDYKIFALTVGSGFALSAPSTSVSELEQAVENIEQDGDIYFGAAVQPINASLGINMGWLVEDLYATVKFGYSNISEGTLVEDFSFKSLTLGVLADYQVFQSRSLPLGFIRWRGLTVGSGLMFQSNESVFKMALEVDPVAADVPLADEYAVPGLTDLEADLEIQPELTLGVSSHSISIPLEVTTGVRLLWLIDLNVGVGIDLAFGDSNIDLSIESPVYVDTTSDWFTFNDGSILIDLGTEGNGPQLVRPRLTAGVGFNLGPVKLDVPMMYYIDTKGVSAMVGLNIGFVW